MADFRDRVEKGREIASEPGQIERVAKNIFSVRSQSGLGVYIVSSEGGHWKCICPDFLGHNLPCKHILAVRLHEKGFSVQTAVEQEKRRPKPTYGQDWSAYNQAQRAELRLFDEVLFELVSDIEDPLPTKRTGRPRLPLRDVLYCTVEKVYHRIPLRVTQGLSDRSRAEHRISCSPSYNMPSIVLRRADVTPILHDLIAKSALALASIEETFAVDSSGFRTTSFGDYCREKYGAPSHNVWKKAHIIIGTKSHIIPCVAVTDGHAADCPRLPGLVDGTVAAGFVLKEVYADKGYLSGENFHSIGTAGGVPYIMFKQNSRGRTKKQRTRSPFWKKMWHLFQSNPSEFLSHYHRRENVEATFAAIKKKLGETISSRDPVAQVNELLCKVLAYNITVVIHEAFEHGILLPGFPTPEPKEPGPVENESKDPVTPGEWTPRSAPSWEDN